MVQPQREQERRELWEDLFAKAARARRTAQEARESARVTLASCPERRLSSATGAAGMAPLHAPGGRPTTSEAGSAETVPRSGPTPDRLTRLQTPAAARYSLFAELSLGFRGSESLRLCVCPP